MDDVQFEERVAIAVEARLAPLLRKLEEALEHSRQEKCLTVKQAAERLCVTPGTVYKLIRQGELRAARVTSGLRISPDDFRDFLDDDAVNPPPAPKPRPVAPRGPKPKGYVFFPPKP
jgi:excisionase family DNA binding protein